ncbi:hypothetical protein CI109_103142 [Kwoniella shandongensis]|uniref:RRM domain-containing protein n=1 Tax=Kwoniella shandongensis TaxID=1734106 RepID=A0AAJ8LGA7_9TREE
MTETSSTPNVEDLLSELTRLLADLEKTPDNVQLLRRQIRLMEQLGMTAEVLDAYGRLSSLVMLSDESFVEILEKFDQAEKDYLSLAVLTRHVEFITSSYQAAKDASAAVSEEVVEFLTQDTARSMLRGVAQRAQGLLNESQAVWQPWLDWELQQLEGAADRQSALENIHTIFLERMATPHLDPASSAQILTSYSAWESDQRLKPGGTGKAPTADHGLTRAVFERTVAQYANIASSSETTLVDLNASIQQAKKDSKGKGKQKSREDVAELDTLMDQRRAVEEAIRAYKDAEASIWAKYASWAERNGAEPTDLTTTFERSLSLGLLEFPIGRSIDLVEVFLSRAAYESRVEPHESANKPGDTTFKLEKFMLEWAPELLDQALMLLDKPSKARSRRGALDDARELFIKSIQRHDLDWPEAIYEAFIQFENVHGGLDTLFEARQHIEKEQEKVTKRREKAALEAQSYQQYTAPAPVEETAEPMVVDASEPVPQPASAPEEDDSRLKRGEFTAFLCKADAQCGRVRETIVLSDDNVTTDSALVEFKLAEAIPLVLAKDHRKLDGNEISISMLWRSTLFVTNFPREMDDEAIRRLFGQTRWPSRKYSDTRRFCYITMESPSVAQEATVLNGYKTDGGFGLTVLISDPSVKAKRSDATNSTLFIGGLNAKTTEADVRSLFHEAEAKACLSLQGKHNPDDAAEKRSRSVRLSNLPDNAQEGLLQQALEKFVPVKRLEMFARSHEAVAELESQAVSPIHHHFRLTFQDAGKLLLRTEPFLFEGQEITIAEQARRPPPPPPTPAAGAAPESSTMFAPRAARKGKVIAKPRPTAAVAASKPNQTQAGQDDFRALVAAKNKQREDNLAGARGDASGEKRKSENEEQEQDAKRPRQ